MIVLAVAYLVRAVGDVSGDAEMPSPLSWLSPIGWGQQVRPYAGDRFAVLLDPARLHGSGPVGRLRAGVASRPRRRAAAGSRRTGRGGAPSLAEPAGTRLATAVPDADRLAGGLRHPERRRREHRQRPERDAGHPADAGDGGGPRRDRRHAGCLRGDGVQHPGVRHGGLRNRRRPAASPRRRPTATRSPSSRGSVSRTRFVASHLVVALVGTTLLTLVQGSAFAFANAAQTGHHGSRRSHDRRLARLPARRSG